jgi:hypothetical protein
MRAKKKPGKHVFSGLLSKIVKGLETYASAVTVSVRSAMRADLPRRPRR